MKRRAPLAIVLALVIIAGGAGATLAARGLLLPAALQVSGRVRGESISAKQQGLSELAGLAASVRCNGVAATATTAGDYHLTVPHADRYTCTISGPPGYAPRTVELPKAVSGPFTLNVGDRDPTDTTCQVNARTAVASCPPLLLLPGGIAGRVVNKDGDSIGGAYALRCGLKQQLSEIGLVPDWHTATVRANGSFTVTGLATGDYTCVVTATVGNADYQQVHVDPGKTAALNFTLCNPDCPALHYHLGLTMHSYTAYLIFWLPKGFSFEPGGDDARYQSLVARYFQDVGGTPYYNLLAQYWDYRGHISNSATLGGVYLDTTPYEHCDTPSSGCRPAAGTQADPLTDQDVQDEVSRALRANIDWGTSIDNEFFVFTASGVQECSSGGRRFCTFNDDQHSFCAYHSAFGSLAAPTIYGYVPAPVAGDTGCILRQSPNGDAVADSAIAFAGHEQFESVTDPFPDGSPGWFEDRGGDDSGESEIADVCVGVFGPIGADGGNITLANGHRYLVQAQYSNASDGCAFA